MQDALVVRGLEKSYGETRALAGFDLDVAAGEIVALLGPNGAGKTTAVSAIVGGVRCDAGQILLFGRAFTPDDPEARRRIGFVPQEQGIYAFLTAEENLRFVAELYGVRGAGRRIQQVAAEVGLDGRLHERPSDFSGGMRRRLSLAMGLLHQPQLLLLDEPAGGIDPQSRDRLAQSARAAAESGAAVLYTTHHMEEVESLCDRVVIMDAGRVVESGRPDEIVARHGRWFVDLDPGPDPLTEGSIAELHALECVESVDVGRCRLRLAALPGRSPVSGILNLLHARGREVRSMRVREPSLESAFLHLTGRELRD
jgi:ABC-2 type transport system ATP-binding protein